MTKIHFILNFFFNRDVPEDAQRRIQDWMIDLGSAKDKDKCLFEIWNELKIEADNSTAYSFQQTQKKIQEQSSQKKPKSWVRIITLVAAVVSIPILSMVGTSVFIQSNDRKGNDSKEIELAEYFVRNGEIKETTLPDGSVVTLNSGSILIYPEKFYGKTRSIYLNGQANFVVAKDSLKPFIVKTTYMDIEALGTVFDVSSYSNDSKVFTTLESGSVKVDVKKDEQTAFVPVILSPDEQIVYDCLSGALIKKQINQRYTSAWRKGSLVFQSASLNDIANTLERRYDVTIYYNSNKYSSETITVKFVHGETLEASFKILQQIITNFKYKIEGKKVYIY